MLACLATTIFGALAFGAAGSGSPPIKAASTDTSIVTLEHICGHTFRVRNYSTASVSVTWDVVGTTEQGTLVLPPKPAGEGFSATLFTPQHVGTVRLLYQGQVLQSKQNEGGPPCPAEPVGLQPPDSVPAWFYDDTSYAKPGLTLKRIVWVVFRPAATGAERASAIMSVGGTLVGGARVGNLEGYYYIGLSATADEAALREAAASLRALPYVAEAGLEVLGGIPQWLKPSDGVGFQRANWRLDARLADSLNWGQEAVAAPLAWGCSTGGQAARIAILDHRFESTNFGPNVSDGGENLGLFASDNSHGTAVASILGSVGNDSIGIPGVLWTACPNGSSKSTRTSASGFRWRNQCGASIWPMR